MDQVKRKVSFVMSEDKITELDTYAAAMDMSRSAFMALAVQIGARALARQVVPELFLTPELIKQMQAAGMGLPEQAIG